MKKLLLIPLLSLSVFAYCQSGISGESDSTIIGWSSWYGKKHTTRYYFKKENYAKAGNYVQLANIPYQGRNESAQKEMSELSKYILRTEEVIHKKGNRK